MAIYRDLNADNPTENPDVFDVDAIVQSVIELLKTREGERAFEPEFGLFLEGLLFDLMDQGAALQVYNQVVDKLERYEPRVLLDVSRSDVVPDPDNNIFEVKLFFSIQGFSGQTFEVTESVSR
jgi:phage baseplate assembly protein W